MRKIHLVCNAHLDPVWLWQRNEGMAEAMSTFRIAADFCEKYDGFVFNHNEAVLYEWVQEYEPALFERIVKLVKQGKWCIMSGWYLQPDVVMPCGESIIRQIKTGNDFFEKYFGNIPKTAIGFDAFGHSRGLVQILKKCGYENYAYMRPRDTACGPFVWQGFDGSEINTVRLYEWYNTPKGKALERLESYNRDFPETPVSVLTWGVGNHGGGPSEKDLNDINRFAEKCTDIEYVHSDFDSYFADLDKSGLKTVSTALMHCMVGCYTSMARVKQGHRRLENRLNMCEKMLFQSGVEYNGDEFEKAVKALLFTEFHDVLPGSAVKKTEDDSLRLIGYGDEIIDRLISKSFFALCSGQPKAKEGEIPVLVYNPHPYEVEQDFEVEFQLAEQNDPATGIVDVAVKDENGARIPSQIEQEDSAHGMDWRKKVVFHAKLKPMSICRFDCETWLEPDYIKIKPFEETDTHFVIKTDSITAAVSKTTGMLDKYEIGGENFISSVSIGAYCDNADPWGMEVDSFKQLREKFALLKAPRVIENGAVRTKIQSMLSCGTSFAVVTYTFSKNAKYIDVDVKMLANDENTMFKLSAETTLDKTAEARVQTMFGTDISRKDGLETAFQKWCGLNGKKHSVSIINAGTYGGSFDENTINISLLRTAVYSAHPVDGIELAPDDRIYNHLDMGERDFKFRICADGQYIDCMAETFNQPPLVLSFFPSGAGEKPSQLLELSNKNVMLSALRSEQDSLLLRLYNSQNTPQNTEITLRGEKFAADFNPFEVKTFIKRGGRLVQTDMLGRE